MIAVMTVDAATITLADPTIFCEDGVFYLTGTYSGSGFVMYKSTDLVHWERCGKAAEGLALHKDDVWGTQGFWAPQIFKYDGAYYMAYTANEQIAIAKADSPMGPFRQEVKQELPHDTGQIDPFVFFDDDGKKYLYYVRFDGGNTLYVNELNDDLQSFKPNALKKCLGAEEGWELTREYSDARITEGPTVVKDGGYYYLIYSANHFEDINYAVGYAYSTSPVGPWTKTGRPFLSRHSVGINGTGHGDLLKDADGNWYYVFHVHQSNSQVQSRRTAIVPIALTDDPANKFVPQVDRMMILDDNAAAGKTLPEAAVKFEADGISYCVTNKARKFVQVDFRDPVLFGGYAGEVTIPESVEHDGNSYEVTSVGTGAFYNCPDLRKVHLPESLQQLGAGAFEKSGIRSVEIPKTVTAMGYLTFRDCSRLLDVVMHKTTAPNIAATIFPEATFANGKLWVDAGTEENYQSHSVWSKFARISGIEAGMKKYDFEADGMYYDIISELEATAQPCAQTSVWATYFGPEVTIPATVDYGGTTYAVTAIAKGCFYDCRLVESVTIPEGVTTISSSAFYNCFSLTAITLPSTLSALSTTVFRNCESLTEVTCLAATPPTASSADFSPCSYEGVLRVPRGTKTLYAAANCWKEFKNIVEMDDTAVETVATERQSSPFVYNIAGQRVADDYKGIVIRNGRLTLRGK